uniref:Biotin carboxyl carrier protein of acetyl-CoA carboxylase n=1 Tax=Ptilothamnion sphaericum TaxID=1498216 RepID=A0A4D6WYA9_9FLOR|nr:acetyl-CoA carboxylase, biotin carboxyl carrier protein [Ptilothamnion sphaericum]
MIFNIDQLKQFLLCINDNNIKEVNINSSTLNIIINKTYKEQKLISSLNSIKTNKIKSNQLNDHIIKNNNVQKNKILQIKESESYSTIVSPMVGTFYRSPAPNEPAFVEEHEIVQKKQTVCIIEAMKLMNEIEAELDGEIVEILIKDGDIVDCGQALMKIKKI